MKQNVFIFAALFLLFVPQVTHAADAQEIIKIIGKLVGMVTPIIAALALLFFFWGLSMFILSAGNESKKIEGKGIMVWGVIALFVMMSIWGVVAVLQTTFKIESTETPNLPKIPASSGGSP